MKRLLTTVLLTSILFLGGWTLFHRNQINSFQDAVSLLKQQLLSDPNQTGDPAVPGGRLVGFERDRPLRDVGSQEEFGNRLVAELELDGGGDALLARFAAWPKGLFPGAAELVASLVGAGLERGGTVAILVRARTHLAAVLPALAAAGIPVRGTDIEPLDAVPEVQDLLALTHPDAPASNQRSRSPAAARSPPVPRSKRPTTSSPAAPPRHAPMRQ